MTKTKTKTKTAPKAHPATITNAVLKCLTDNPGYTQTQIAKATGTSRPYVSTVLKRHNRKAFIPSYASQALDMHKADPSLSVMDIATKLGCAQSTVGKAIASNGVEPPAKPAPMLVKAVNKAWAKLLQVIKPTPEVTALANKLDSAIANLSPDNPSTITHAPATATVEPTPPANANPDADALTDAPAKLIDPNASPADIALSEMKAQLDLRPSPADDSVDASVLANIITIANAYTRDNQGDSPGTHRIVSDIAWNLQRWHRDGTTMVGIQLSIIGDKIQMAYA